MLNKADDDRLPWEGGNGEAPHGAGICLSGGGLRAASFGLGVLQELQARRGLLFGAKSAKVLAAVSGGSYTAAAFTMEASRQAAAGNPDDALPPLAPGSPEEQHILNNADYFRPGLGWVRMLALSVLNVAALAMLVVWVGWFVATLALMVGRPLFDSLELEPVRVFLMTIPGPVHVVGLLVGLAFVIRGLFEVRLRRYLLPVFGLVLMALAAPIGIWWLSLQEGAWTTEAMSRMLGSLIAGLAVVTIATLVGRKLGVTGRLASGLNRLTVWSPRLVLLAVLAWATVTWFRVLGPTFRGESGDQLPVGAAFVATLVLGLVASYVPQRASLHREYRACVSSCFGVRRAGPGAAAVIPASLTRLSDLVEGTDARRYPRFLGMATANVSVRTAAGTGRAFVPFALTHDVCGVPGYSGASFTTKQLELLEEPRSLTSIRAKEPLISVMTAVATAGAAVSPSMGRHTIPSAGMLIAAINLRPGRWVPNPFNGYAKEKVRGLKKPGALDNDSGIGPGFSELIPELLGLTGKRVYLSDGGHYDNLGLIAVLRAKCAEIWCVDASAESGGQAAELRRVIGEAVHEGVIQNATIDASQFLAGPDRLFRSTHAVGDVTYADGTKARLIVIKLGMTIHTPAELRNRRRTFKGWPHHATWRQIYRRDRMDAYRQLGRDSTNRCIATLDGLNVD